MTVPRYIYGLRGWIAFVAFMDIGTAMRCFFDTDFLKLRLYINFQLNDYSLMNRLFGMWSILNATILLHCALCIHYFPVFVMAICSLALSILMYAVEAFIYGTMCEHSLCVLIPVCIKGITIVLLAGAPSFIWIPGKDFGESDEDEILRKALPNKKKWNKRRIFNECNSTFDLPDRKVNWPAIKSRD